jgi:cytochrome c oxidase subunit 2
MLGVTRWWARPRMRRAALFPVCAVIGSAALAMTARVAYAFSIRPRPWEISMQPAATPVKARLIAFNHELDIITFLIGALVLGLLLYCILRFNSRRHPVPSHITHHTPIEVLWTVIPVLILVIIAVPSFKLMYYEADVPPGTAMTIDVIGHQWYWQYKYPDQGGLSFYSNIVPASALKPGQPRLLTVNNPLVVPAHTNIRVQITSADVIHSWFVPSFGVQEYAMPGQVNVAWFNVDRPGTYYGECNQLCGINHAFMPIEIKALSKADFQRWLVTAKKQFASNDNSGGTVQLAALARSN